MPATQPTCDRCRRPHRSDLPCWKPPYSTQLCEQTYRLLGRWCAQCRREGTQTRATTVDHITPRALGGGDELRNREPLCAHHNSAKGARTTDPYPAPEPVAGNGQPISARFR